VLELRRWVAGTLGLTWLNSQTPATGSSPIATVVADFNRDGKADLAVLNQGTSSGGLNPGSGTLTILLGNGDGTFAATSNSPAVGTNPTAIATGDINSDGILDLAVTNQNDPGTVTILLGNGNGTFAAIIPIPVVGGPESIVMGDFNGDGIPDLVVASYDQSNLTVLLGHGDGTFTSSTAGPIPSDFSHSLAVADLNGDRVQDVVVQDQLGTLEVLRRRAMRPRIGFLSLRPGFGRLGLRLRGSGCRRLQLGEPSIRLVRLRV